MARIYAMEWNGAVWTLQCQTITFHQCYEGRIDAENRFIVGAWWKSDDGKNWEKDFDVISSRTDAS